MTVHGYYESFSAQQFSQNLVPTKPGRFAPRLLSQNLLISPPPAHFRPDPTRFPTLNVPFQPAPPTVCYIAVVTSRVSISAPPEERVGQCRGREAASGEKWRVDGHSQFRSQSISSSSATRGVGAEHLPAKTERPFSGPIPGTPRQTCQPKTALAGNFRWIFV